MQIVVVAGGGPAFAAIGLLYCKSYGVGIVEKNSFSNCIVTGTLAGNDGRKMSKSYGNYTDPNILMDEYSADALRFLLLSSP